MRDVSVDFAQALQNATTRGIIPRRFLRVTAKSVEGVPTHFDFWTGDHEVTLDIPSGVTGELETRTYTGGVNLKIGTIPRTSDLTVQTIQVSVSAIPALTQSMVREYNVRLAKVEVHVGLLDPDTPQIIPDPVIEFLGEIDESPIETGSINDESLINFSIRSDAISMLDRTNPRKRSHQGQARRANDQFGRYSSAVGSWKVRWGMGDQNDNQPKYGWQRTITNLKK